MQDAVERMEAWAKTLKDGQAPHQQQLADDALKLVDHVKSTRGVSTEAQPADVVSKDLHDDIQAQLYICRQNLSDTLDEKAVLEDKVSELEQQVEALTAPKTDDAEDDGDASANDVEGR